MRRRAAPREVFIPKGAMKVTVKGMDAVVYAYSDQQGRPVALGFGGRRSAPDFHNSFRTPERRAAHVKEYFERIGAIQNYKNEQAERRRTYRHTYKPGDILHGSYGYDQTNCEFYEVIETTPGSVTLRAIAAEGVEGTQGHMCESLTACAGQFVGEAITKRPQYPGRVPMKHYGLSLWDGRPKYSSWYA